jgi:hypothetical protein
VVIDAIGAGVGALVVLVDAAVFSIGLRVEEAGRFNCRGVGLAAGDDVGRSFVRDAISVARRPGFGVESIWTTGVDTGFKSTSVSCFWGLDPRLASSSRFAVRCLDHSSGVIRVDATAS